MEEEMRKLINQLNQWVDAYEIGYPEVSDDEWDNVYFQLKELEDKTGIIYDDSPTRRVRYEVVSNLKKIEHNHLMLSLDKTRNPDEFMRHFDKDHAFVVMPKLDGLTCSLTYESGVLARAETRGNGTVGEDVLHNAKVISSIPKVISYKETLIVDGEIICTLDEFEKVSSIYKNPRNYAAGSVRLLDSKECSDRHLTFVVWNVVKGFDESNSFSYRMSEVSKLGFNTVPIISTISTVNFHSIETSIVSISNQRSYPIDGLVSRLEDIEYGESLGSTAHHSNAAFAYKFKDDEYDTKLLDIEWGISRIGVLIPVAVYSPIDIDGTECTRASLHNISIMENILGKYPYIGQKIYVAKTNQVIPQVIKSKKNDDGGRSDFCYLSLPKTCPVCGKPLSLQDDNLVCNNSSCEGRLINRLCHYCSREGTNIAGLSKATLEKLITCGWLNDIEDLYKLKNHKAHWKNLVGFGEKSVESILRSIEESKNCSLAAFIYALGIPKIGKTLARIIAEYFGSWEKLKAAVDSNFKFYNIPGIGPEIANNIYHYDWDRANDLIYHNNICIQEVKKNNNNDELTLANKKIVITGKLYMFKNRDELKEKIQEKGGKVLDTISHDTFVLINNDIESTTAKSKAARKLNIPIVSEDDFVKKYLTT